VQHTDTLQTIAGKFNTTVDKLKEANGLETSEVRAGQTLVIAQ
jgi:LysM repeat protein